MPRPLNPGLGFLIIGSGVDLFSHFAQAEKNFFDFFLRTLIVDRWCVPMELGEQQRVPAHPLNRLFEKYISYNPVTHLGAAEIP